MRNNYDEAFSCYQCKEIPEIPYESECCGKLYCQTCWEICTYLNCKLCKALLRFRVSVFAKSILNQFETDCKFGCGLKIKYAQSRQHYLCCESKEYNCYIKYCLFKGNLSQMKKHVQTTHIYEIMLLNEYYSDFKPILNRCCSSLEITGQFYQAASKVKTADVIKETNSTIKSRPLNKKEVLKKVSPPSSLIQQSDPDYDNYEFEREYGNGEQDDEDTTKPLPPELYSSSISAEMLDLNIISEDKIILSNEFTERINKINKDLADTIDCLQKPSLIRPVSGIIGDIIPTMPDSELESHRRNYLHTNEIPEEAKYSEDLKELQNLPYRI